MKLSLVISVFAVAFISVSQTFHLNLGSSINAQLVHTETVKLSGIPFTVRTKNVFYTNATSPKAIKGVTAVDQMNGKAKATVTAGGVGATFVNVKLKSERGSGLHYQIQIFV